MWFLEPLLGTRCCGLIPSVRFRSCLASRRTEWSLKASLKSLRFLSIFETFARDDRLCCARPRGRDLSNMLHSLERVLPTSEMPELVNELDSVLLKHPTCLQQNHAGNRKNNGGFFKAAMEPKLPKSNKLTTNHWPAKAPCIAASSGLQCTGLPLCYVREIHTVVYCPCALYMPSVASWVPP